MLVIGMTGGIATGKSTVSNLLKKRNIPVVDADVLAREVVEPGTPALGKIVTHFGGSVLLLDGTLDRKKLGSIVFSDESKRKKLNSIVHPAVQRAMLWAVLGNWFRGEKYCVLDVPLLIEGGLWKVVGKVVVVYCPSELQLERLMKRDGSTREDALSRLNSQLPIEQKAQYADQIVDNSHGIQELETRVDTLVSGWEREAGVVWWISWVLPPFAVLSAIWTLGWRSLHRPRLRKP